MNAGEIDLVEMEGAGPWETLLSVVRSPSVVTLTSELFACICSAVEVEDPSVMVGCPSDTSLDRSASVPLALSRGMIGGASPIFAGRFELG